MKNFIGRFLRSSALCAGFLFILFVQSSSAILIEINGNPLEVTRSSEVGIKADAERVSLSITTLRFLVRETSGRLWDRSTESLNQIIDRMDGYLVSKESGHDLTYPVELRSSEVGSKEFIYKEVDFKTDFKVIFDGLDERYSFLRISEQKPSPLLRLFRVSIDLNSIELADSSPGRRSPALARIFREDASPVERRPQQGFVPIRFGFSVSPFPSSPLVRSPVESPTRFSGP
jgi:hypothetical protein